MVIVTHESYDSVLVGTGKQKGLESPVRLSTVGRRAFPVSGAMLLIQ